MNLNFLHIQHEPFGESVLKTKYLQLSTNFFRLWHATSCVIIGEVHSAESTTAA